MIASQSDARVLRQILSDLWSRLLPKLADDERMTLVDCGVIAADFDGWSVLGDHVRVRRDGSIVDGSRRYAAVDIPCRDLVMAPAPWRDDRRRTVDIVSGHLSYLIALLRPPTLPPNWRKFNRRSR